MSSVSPPPTPQLEAEFPSKKLKTAPEPPRSPPTPPPSTSAAASTSPTPTRSEHPITKVKLLKKLREEYDLPLASSDSGSDAAEPESKKDEVLKTVEEYEAENVQLVLAKEFLEERLKELRVELRNNNRNLNFVTKALERMNHDPNSDSDDKDTTQT